LIPGLFTVTILVAVPSQLKSAGVPTVIFGLLGRIYRYWSLKIQLLRSLTYKDIITWRFQSIINGGRSLVVKTKFIGATPPWTLVIRALPSPAGPQPANSDTPAGAVKAVERVAS
jgi:hypothetical protein